MSSNNTSKENLGCNSTVSNNLKHAQLYESTRKNIVHSIFQLYGSKNISWNQIQSVFEIMNNVVGSEFQMIERHLESTYRHNINGMIVVSELKNIFKTVNNVFNCFSTDHNRLRVLEESGFYFAPIEFFIGQRSQTTLKRYSDGSMKIKKQIATGYLYPLRQIFKKVFELPNVFNTVFAYINQLIDEPAVSNFIQSDLWKHKVKNFHSKHVLPLFLFSDDYEIGNGLGSHAGVHKLAGTYISIPCLPPFYQSLNSIFHAIIYSSKDRQEFGNHAVYRTLIEELKFLEKSGIELDLPQGNTKIYFKLGLILGDNLGLHSLLGFVENFNANYCCRFCKMTKLQRSLATMEDKSLLRTYDNYEYDLKLNNSNVTGIKKKCVFNSLPGYHVTQNYAVDMMHDLLRGVFHFDLIAMINHYIYRAKLFSLAELSSRMKVYDYGILESKNKPPEILANHLQTDSLKMSAGELLTFIRHLGIIVGDMIPEDDITWRVYLNLRQILDIVSSRSIQKGCRSTLDNLVCEHHLLARRILKRNLKAKDHLLTHYGSVFAACGPIINSSCMRFEAKHQESKIDANIFHSKVNVCQTLTKKHQLKLAYLLYSNTLFSSLLTTGPTYKQTLKNLALVFDCFLKEHQLSYNESLHFYSWVEKYKCLYKPNMVLCLSEIEDKFNFGVIKYLFIKNEILFYICQKVNTIFNSHVHAFQVTAFLNEYCITQYEKLYDQYPTAMTTNKNIHYILHGTTI